MDFHSSETTSPMRTAGWWLTFIGLGLIVLTAAAYAGTIAYLQVNQSRILHRSRQLLGKGKTDEARDVLMWLVWSNPDHADALLLMGKSCSAEQNFAGAAEWFGRIGADSTRHTQAQILRAKAFLNDANFDEAEEILVRYPESPTAYEELKWLYFNQFRTRELESFLLQQLRQHPEKPNILIDLLYTEVRKQIAEEGLGTLQKIDQRHPGQPSIILALAFCQWRLGETEQAWKHFQSALKYRPNHLDTRLLAADFLLEHGRTEAAETLLRPNDSTAELAAQFENDDRWWWLQSRLSRIRGHINDALREIEQAVQRRSHELAYLQFYGTLLRESGNQQLATQILQQAKEIETCKARLEFLVLNGDLENPTAEVCREVSQLCRKRGRIAQAEGWSRLVGVVDGGRNRNES